MASNQIYTYLVLIDLALILLHPIFLDIKLSEKKVQDQLFKGVFGSSLVPVKKIGLSDPN